MPIKPKGPRLWLRPARKYGQGQVTPPTWWIRDGSVCVSTGFREHEKGQAETVFADYLAGRKEDKTYYVYFISAKSPDFPIKIGISTTHAMRFAQIQSSLPFDIDVLAVVPVKDPLFERRLHRRFAATRLRGEWFMRSDELMAMINQLLEQNVAA